MRDWRKITPTINQTDDDLRPDEKSEKPREIRRKRRREQRIIAKTVSHQIAPVRQLYPLLYVPAQSSPNRNFIHSIRPRVFPVHSFFNPTPFPTIYLHVVVSYFNQTVSQSYCLSISLALSRSLLVCPFYTLSSQITHHPTFSSRHGRARRPRGHRRSSFQRRAPCDVDPLRINHPCAHASVIIWSPDNAFCVISSHAVDFNAQKSVSLFSTHTYTRLYNKYAYAPTPLRTHVCFSIR